MKTALQFLVVCCFCSFAASAQLPTPSLVGYWQNWNDANAPYIPLSNIDSRYNVIEVSFAVPAAGTDYQMEFVPDGVSSAVFISQVQALQSQGKKVLISMGGATAPVSLDNVNEKNTFISTMNTIIDTYGFDGIDIDFEGSSISVTGGTIGAPVDAKIINLIDAVKQIMQHHRTVAGNKLLLTMAPETAFVQGGMSAYGGIWGAYLPVIHALRDSLDMLQVQLYNSGSMYGIDGKVYTQGTADFIVAMTEAVIAGFNTAGGMFIGLSPDKVSVTLPACPSAAGGGFADTSVVRKAVNYIRGVGPKPGAYTMQQPSGYIYMQGMSTWSINWDAVASCAGPYQYADNYQTIFNTLLPVHLLAFTAILEQESLNLKWQVENEQNFDRYEVERSSNGREFNKIGTVKAINAKEYSFIDDKWQITGDRQQTLYYRLKMLDRDGKFSYSKIQTVTFNIQNKAFTIYPNPATTTVTLLLDKNINDKITIEFVDAAGKVVMSKGYNVSGNNITISTSKLPAGIYSVKMTYKDESYLHKLVIQ